MKTYLFVVAGELALLIVGYLLLAGSIKKMRRAAAQAEIARQRANEQAAYQAKYLTPRMTEAEIAEMHATRWAGD